MGSKGPSADVDINEDLSMPVADVSLDEPTGHTSGHAGGRGGYGFRMPDFNKPKFGGQGKAKR